MAITHKPDNTIYLGGGQPGPGGQGGYTLENRYAASGAITPGDLIELANSSGTPVFRRHATASGFATPTFALEQIEWQKGIDDDYASADVVKAATMMPGSKVLALVGSGENIVPGDFLESAGNGKLKEGSTHPIARAIGTTGGAVTADTRVIVEVM